MRTSLLELFDLWVGGVGIFLNAPGRCWSTNQGLPQQLAYTTIGAI